MKGRFVNLLQRINCGINPSEEFKRIEAMYSQKGRFYHNLSHVRNCLKELDISPYEKDKNPIEFAIWYHDIIYNPKAQDNEERSADVAASTAIAGKVPTKFIADVRRLIFATKHDIIPVNEDTKLMTDIDLSILGSHPEDFSRYETEIRAEYSFVSEEMFRQERAKILRSFIDRKDIYSTDFFRNKYERQARKNLAESIERLTKPL